MDFFTVSTAGFRILYVLVILNHERRKIVHFNVSENPTSEWTTQQVIEDFPWDTAPKYLMRGRDSIYGEYFKKRVKSMGIEEDISAYRSPWQNPFVERMIGSIRRDCLDHTNRMIIFNEGHLKRILKSYFEYYHNDRTQLGLDKDTPIERPSGRYSVIANATLCPISSFFRSDLIFANDTDQIFANDNLNHEIPSLFYEIPM